MAVLVVFEYKKMDFFITPHVDYFKQLIKGGLCFLL